MKTRKRAPGAGRPRLPDDQRRKPKQMKFPPDIIGYLDAQENATSTVEAMIRRSSGFRKWKARKE